MNAEFFAALDALESENGIPKNYMLEKIETALITAFKRDNNNNTNVKVYLDENKKEIKVYQLKDVVEAGTAENPALQIEVEDAKKVNHRYEVGDVAEIEFKPKDFGRISAQTAKQVIIQGIREHERGMLAKEYENKKEELITATVYKVDPVTGNAVLNIGKGEAVLNKTEQIPGEVLKEGEQLKVYVTEVRNQVKGPVVNLSRKHQGFIKRLFELEVPEITDGTVIINAVTREPGSRTKMAVSSANKDVDPIGSCIGAKGARINIILNEIKPEKVDIIKYSDDPVEYIKAALSPSAVIEVKVNAEEKTCRVLVESSQLSLAIGKEGQNARLAAKLTGYKIDIKTPTPEEQANLDDLKKSEKKEKRKKEKQAENE